MRRSVTVAVSAVLLLVVTLLVTVLGEEEDIAAPGDCLPRDRGGQQAPEGVPDGTFSRPMRSADATLTSGWRTADRPDHKGVDFAGPVGAPIYAMADGVVAQAGEASGFGQWIVIDHQLEGQLYSTVYGHMFPEGVHVKAGETVRAGQHIADEGYNGQTDPPDSRGAHLHFEVWAGGRLSGGEDTDPMPWIEHAAEPGSSIGQNAASTPHAAPVPSESTTAPPNLAGGAAPAQPLEPLGEVGSEEHLQVDAVRVARIVHATFPQITDIGGWRPPDEYGEHSSGRAIDIMIPGYDTTDGVQLGDTIRDYLYTHRDELRIESMIWRQSYIPSNGAQNEMEDRGSPTANHYDHIHVLTLGGGYPTPDQTYAPGPAPGDSVSPSAPDPSCTLSVDPEHADSSDLDPTKVPPEFHRWLELSAQQCQELTPELLAAQLQQESGFKRGLTSPAGAQGYTQFTPDTWAAWGYKVDDNGQRIGPAGSGDPNNIGDAVMAQGAYDCYCAEQLRPHIASGELTGDPIRLMLAAYNAGPGAVLQYGGVPPYAETQNYVTSIQALTQEMAGISQ